MRLGDGIENAVLTVLLHGDAEIEYAQAVVLQWRGHAAAKRPDAVPPPRAREIRESVLRYLNENAVAAR